MKATRFIIFQKKVSQRKLLWLYQKLLLITMEITNECSEWMTLQPHLTHHKNAFWIWKMFDILVGYINVSSSLSYLMRFLNFCADDSKPTSSKSFIRKSEWILMLKDFKRFWQWKKKINNRDNNEAKNQYKTSIFFCFKANNHILRFETLELWSFWVPEFTMFTLTLLLFKK